MTKEELENLLNELIFESYQSALNKEGAAMRANELKARIMEAHRGAQRAGNPVPPGYTFGQFGGAE